jgi:hypothetical protein
MTNNQNMNNVMANPIPLPARCCARCNGQFADFEYMACTNKDEYWHLECLVCAQCLRPFGKDLEYYEYGGLKYCQHDFIQLFAPCCRECHQFIINGRVIRALNGTWHPECFNCQLCRQPLARGAFGRSRGRVLCLGCNRENLAL